MTQNLRIYQGKSIEYDKFNADFSRPTIPRKN